MDDQKLYEMMAQIHKELTRIAHHLKTLATAAQYAHPEAFKQQSQNPPPPSSGHLSQP